MAGLDENGLTIKRQPEIINNLVGSERENIHPDISVRDDELLGQLNTIISSSIAEQWELTAAVNDSSNVLKAEGKNLDDLAVLIGLSRIAATKSSTTTQEFVGNNGVTVPVGTLLQNPVTLDTFNTITPVVLNVSSCLRANYSVKVLENSTTYTISIDGTSYSYESDLDATNLEILNGLEAEITADTLATWSAEVDTVNEQLIITSDSLTSINITSTTFISADEVMAQGSVQAVEEGSISAPPNSVFIILTAIAGFTSTANPQAYIVGRLRETDEDFRARILTSQQSGGKATAEAIQDTLNNLAGVVTAVVIENDKILYDGGSSVVTFTNTTNTVNLVSHGLVAGAPVQLQTTGSTPTGLLPQFVQYWVINPTTNNFQLSLSKGGSVVDFTDDGTGINTILIGRPPKSFETIVQGGTDEDIATTIWQTKPAGIETFGSTTTVINDSLGRPQSIKYTRPTEIYIAILLEYTKYDEETFPNNGENTMAQIALDYTNRLGIGVDVIPSRYFGPIYNAVNGIDSLTVSIQIIASPGDPIVPGSWQTTRLPIDLGDFASTTPQDITVTEV